MTTGGKVLKYVNRQMTYFKRHMFSEITVRFLSHDPDEPLYKNSGIMDRELVEVCLKFNSNQEYSTWYFMP